MPVTQQKQKINQIKNEQRTWIEAYKKILNNTHKNHKEISPHIIDIVYYKYTYRYRK